MANDKAIRNVYKGMIKSVDATDEQINFLLENYLEKDYIIGIHNTERPYESFFENGLSNQTSMGIDSNDLDNTVMYSDNFASLMVYPNGDGEKRGKTAIILKIPKKVFTHEQGIFETLANKKHGIPPQFIVGAFHDGMVVSNEGYNKEYVSESATKCTDRVNMQDKELHAKVFRKVYESKRTSLKDRITNFLRKITGRNQERLLLTEGTGNARRKLGEVLADEYGAPTLQEQKQFVDNLLGDNFSKQQSNLGEVEEEKE